MTRTRLSLYYLAGYLLTGGVGLLFAPALFLRLFLSNGTYELLMVRFVGLLLLALSIMVIQIIRRQAFELYSATLAARAVILAGLAAFYLISRDPLMLVLIGIVGLGFVLTAVSFWLDKAHPTNFGQ